MGFAEKWVNWIRICISTVTYNFLLSGNEIGPITPSRGLRQGDPISLYLFLLCAEGLTTLINRNQIIGGIHGCKIVNGAPIVTHLFFADDCYLFFRATISEDESIKECLILYERASGQQVNFQKSSIYFSSNTTPPIMQAVSQVLQVTIRNDLFYLGLPKFVSRNKWEVFRYI